jgi:lipid-A-disaccharide synthase
VLPLAAGLARSQVTGYLASRPDVAIHVVENATYDALAAADLAIVSSGTATVEAALLDVPMVVIYRVAPTTAWIARRLVRTPFFAMVNLIAGRRVVPELIQDDFTPESVAHEAERLLGLQEARAEMRVGLALVRERLGPPGAIERAAGIIAGMLTE